MNTVVTPPYVSSDIYIRYFHASVWVRLWRNSKETVKPALWIWRQEITACTLGYCSPYLIVKGVLCGTLKCKHSAALKFIWKETSKWLLGKIHRFDFQPLHNLWSIVYGPFKLPWLETLTQPLDITLLVLWFIE